GRQRKIEKNQMMSKLKIAAFASDLRADENARAILFGEPRGIPIALNQVQPFMEYTHLQVAHTLTQCRFNFIDLGLGTADQKNFFGSYRFQEANEPGDARIV